MSIFQWLSSCFTGRARAMSMYKRGMAKAKKHDHQGAVEDYTAMIDMPGTSTELTAMVLYNRALVHFAAGDVDKGGDDLKTVLAMDEVQVNVKSMARQKLARMESRAIKSKERAS